MPPPPPSLTTISCKYENRQILQFTTEFTKTQTKTTQKNKHCAILPGLCRHCQSKAKHSRIWAQAMPFLPIKQIDLWHSDLESGVRPMCDVDYLCASFSLPRPLFSRVRPDVHDRQTDVRQKHRLMSPPIRGGGITTIALYVCFLAQRAQMRHGL